MLRLRAINKRYVKRKEFREMDASREKLVNEIGCQEYKGMPREKTSKPGSREVADIRKGCQEKVISRRKKRPDKEAPERSERGARRMSMSMAL